VPVRGAGKGGSVSSRPGIEAVRKAAAVDVERLKDVKDGLYVDAPVEGPLDDIEVFLTGFEAIENSIQEEGVIVELSFEEAEIASVQLNPKASALKVFEPTRSEVAAPMLFHPKPDRAFAEVVPGLFAFDPFEAQGLLLALGVDAALLHQA
jgi:hypothetical protein